MQARACAERDGEILQAGIAWQVAQAEPDRPPGVLDLQRVREQGKAFSGLGGGRLAECEGPQLRLVKPDDEVACAVEDGRSSTVVLRVAAPNGSAVGTRSPRVGAGTASR